MRWLGGAVKWRKIDEEERLAPVDEEHRNEWSTRNALGVPFGESDCTVSRRKRVVARDAFISH